MCRNTTTRRTYYQEQLPTCGSCEGHLTAFRSRDLTIDYFSSDPSGPPTEILVIGSLITYRPT